MSESTERATGPRAGEREIGTATVPIHADPALYLKEEAAHGHHDDGRKFLVGITMGGFPALWICVEAPDGSDHRYYTVPMFDAFEAVMEADAEARAKGGTP